MITLITIMLYWVLLSFGFVLLIAGVWAIGFAILYINDLARPFYESRTE